MALRIVPIVLFLYQARRLLQSIQCQTSSDFAELRWGNATKKSDLLFAEPSAYLHGLSSTLLFGADDYDSCLAVSMIPHQIGDFATLTTELRGSLSRLWPLFGTLCLSHFLETISCAVQGRPVAVETGMTLFEHSLAFAEADAAISNQLGWGLFTSGNSTLTFPQSSGPSTAITRSMIMRRVNTPPEVLLVAFISAMSHVTSHVLAIMGVQSRYRLYSTGFWALSFMGSIVLEAFNFSLEDPSSMGLFRFPTVCIVGFVPHLMVFGGIIMCGCIYGMALCLSALEPPPEQGDAGRPPTFWNRLMRAHGNMQANISLSDIRITREMDFYTALLRTGFGVITMASEAVYLNEDRRVSVKDSTWLEEERYRELDNLRMQWAGTGLDSSYYNSVGTIGLIPVKDGQLGVSNGYTRERAAQKVPKSRLGERKARDGVGATERSSRWLLALDFILNINRLLLRWIALVILKLLPLVGLRTQPRILLWLARWPKSNGKKDESQSGQGDTGGLHPAKPSRADGRRAFLNDELADVEAETRRILKRSPETADLSEEEINSRLYRVWKQGGLWGSVDTSGDWVPDEDDDWDTTSVATSVAGSTIGDDEDDRRSWIDESEYGGANRHDGLSDGQRTPTQRSPARTRSGTRTRESTPFVDQPIPMDTLARLLHPTTSEERNEAHALAAHLSSDRVITRSQYARMQQGQRARLLLSSPRHGRSSKASSTHGTGGPHAGNSSSSSNSSQFRKPLSPDEEAELLEQLIFERRRRRGGSVGPGGSGAGAQQEGGTAEAGHDDGGSGGGSGPLCVVCQCASRTVIVWPCRCLSLCDECRVTLAMNNFDKCVCCRREVISFSRIYVP